MISISSKSYLQLKIFGRRSVLLTIRCKMFCWNLQNLPVSKSLDSREYLPIPGFNESMSYCIFVNVCEYLSLPGFNQSILSFLNVFVQSQFHLMNDFIYNKKSLQLSQKKVVSSNFTQAKIDNKAIKYSKLEFVSSYDSSRISSLFVCSRSSWF